MDEASVRSRLVDIGTRAAIDEDRHGCAAWIGTTCCAIGVEAGRFTGSAGIAARKSKEALERVIKLIVTQTTGERELLRQVIGQFAKCRIIAVNALLHGKPDIAVGSGNRDGIGNIVDDVVLVDDVRLTLCKQTTNEPHGCVRRAGNTQFTEAFPIRVNTLNILVRVHEVPGIVIEIIAVSSERVVEIGIIGIVQLCFCLTAQMSARRGDIPIADLTFNGKRGLNPFIAAALRVVLHSLQFTGCLAGAFL